jgi:hypothetical protein
LNKHLKLPVLSNTIRDFYKRNTVSDFEQLSPSIRAAFQKELLLNQINREESELGGFITDRSVIDYAAHTELDSDMSQTDKLMYFRLIQERIKSYTHVIYIPPMFKAEDEHLRADMGKQDSIANIMEHFARDWTPAKKFYVIKNKDLEKRVEECLAFINIDHKNGS